MLLVIWSGRLILLLLACILPLLRHWLLLLVHGFPVSNNIASIIFKRCTSTASPIWIVVLVIFQFLLLFPYALFFLSTLMLLPFLDIVLQLSSILFLLLQLLLSLPINYWLLLLLRWLFRILLLLGVLVARLA